MVAIVAVGESALDSTNPKQGHPSSSQNNTPQNQPTSASSNHVGIAIAITISVLFVVVVSVIVALCLIRRSRKRRQQDQEQQNDGKPNKPKKLWENEPLTLLDSLAANSRPQSAALNDSNSRVSSSWSVDDDLEKPVQSHPPSNQ